MKIPSMRTVERVIGTVKSVKDLMPHAFDGEEGLLGINKDMMSKIIIAYEPVWAIGTGINAVPNQVEESHDMIREILLDLYSINIANDIPILYGGSVKPDNSEELIKTKGVDGFLIGGASLNLELFSGIIENVHNNSMR